MKKRINISLGNNNGILHMIRKNPEKTDKKT